MILILPSLILLFSSSNSFSFVFVQRSERISILHKERFRSYNKVGLPLPIGLPRLLLHSTQSNEDPLDSTDDETGLVSTNINRLEEGGINISVAKSIPQSPPSVTKSDRNTVNSNPLVLGEVTMDGSLLVLIPSAVIALLGIIMSINIALNSSDEIIAALNSIEVKPRNELSVPQGECRGLCSTQEKDLLKMSEFMKGFQRSTDVSSSITSSD